MQWSGNGAIVSNESPFLQNPKTAVRPSETWGLANLLLPVLLADTSGSDKQDRLCTELTLLSLNKVVVLQQTLQYSLYVFHIFHFKSGENENDIQKEG